MRIHYALMDDLCSWEEFERRVEDKAGVSGDEFDERDAAREVVLDAGRLHTSISALRAGPSLVSFFCRVIEVKKAERFDRPDGGYGFRSRILCGDDTGEVILILWDDKAFAAEEVSEGEVLEVVGRFRRRGTIDVADLRKPENPPEISLRKYGMRTLNPVSLRCVILAFAGNGIFQASNGSDSNYIRLIIGDSMGEAEVVFWNNKSPNNFETGDPVCISGLYEKPSLNAMRSYSADEKSLVTLLSAEDGGMHKFSSLVSGIYAGWKGSLSVFIEDPGEVREFMTRRGVVSHVRNLQISDDSGDTTLVIWGDQACLPFVQGDYIDVFFAEAKSGSNRDQDDTENSSSLVEIHAGYRSFICLNDSGGKPVCIKGILTMRNGYYTIDNSDCCYQVRGIKDGMFPCMEAQFYGNLYDSGRFEVNMFEICREDLNLVKGRLDEFMKRLGC